MSESDKVVLVLTEHADRLWQLEHHLLEAGYAVLSAKDPLQALDHLASAAVIDLLLVDEPFAGPLTGPELIEACLPRRPRMRLLVLSAQTDRAPQHAEAYPVLPKPLSLEQLGRAVLDVLRGPPVQPWL